ncbi:hypothetical protein ACVWZT_004394 [Pseudomonas sp. TE21394]
MSQATSRRVGMRGVDWLVLGACLWILASVAFAHQGHAPQLPAPQPAVPALGSDGGGPACAPVHRVHPVPALPDNP